MKPPFRRLRVAVCLALVALPVLLNACSRSEKARARATRTRAPATEPPADELRFLCPKDYFGDDLIRGFEKENDARVHLIPYADEEDFNRKWKGGAGGHDLLLPPQEQLIEILKAGYAAPLDQKTIPNLKHVDPRLLGPPYDPENRYTVPFAYQPLIALGVRTDRVTKPVTGLDVLFDEQYRGRIGIADSADKIVGTYLMYLGLSPGATEPANLVRVKELLFKQRPLVREFAGDSLAEKLRTGEVWLALDNFANLVEFLHGEDKNTRVLVPDTGAPLYVDSLCVAKDSPRAERARAFINYLLRPDVSLQFATENRFVATVNLEARAKLKADLRENAALYPLAPARIKALSNWLYPLDRKSTAVEALWKEVKAAKP